MEPAMERSKRDWQSQTLGEWAQSGWIPVDYYEDFVMVHHRLRKQEIVRMPTETTNLILDQIWCDACDEFAAAKTKLNK